MFNNPKKRDMIKNTFLLFLLLLFGISGLRAQTVQIQNAVTAPGNPVLVSVDMLGFTGTNGSVGSLTLQIQYDNNLLSFQGITNINPSFATGSWVSSSTGSLINITYSISGTVGSDINAKIFDLKFGYPGGFNGTLNFVTGNCEVSNSYLAVIPATYINGSITQTGAVASVDLGSAQQASVTSQVLVPVNMSGAGLLPFNAFTFKIGYDPTKLTFVQTANNSLSGTLVASAANGVVTVNWTGFTSTLPDPNVFDLKFTYNGGGNAPIEFRPGCEITNSSAGLISTSYTNGLVEPAPATSTIEMPDLFVSLNSTVSVPVTLNYTGSGFIGGVDLRIGYDNSLLAFTGVTPGTIPSGITASAANGVITVIWNNANNVASLNGTLLNLNFNCNTVGSSDLKFNAGTTVTQTNLSNVILNYNDGSLTVCNASIVSHPANTSVAYLGTAVFNVNVINPCTYLWQVSTDGGSSWTDLADGGNYSGVTTGSLTITNTPVSFDGYKYRCFLGVLTSNAATLTMLPAVVVTDPVNQTINLGDNTTFNVVATGVATYQWQISSDGISFSDLANDAIYSTVATATLGITNAVAAMNGKYYRCVLTPGPPVQSAAAILTVNPLTVNTKVLLQGAYNGTGSMNATLNTAGYLPLVQPYSGAPWNYAGTESVASIPNVNVVDWVLVELRTGTASATMVARKAGFVLKSGAITGLDGVTAMTFPGMDLGNFYIVVRHRNHLPIMSAAAESLNSISLLYDFTTASNKAYGTNPMATLNGPKFGLWGGNVNLNVNVRYNGPANDVTALFSAIGNLVVNGYLPTDVNMNGISRFNGPSNDKSAIFNYVGNSVATSQVP